MASMDKEESPPIGLSDHSKIRPHVLLPLESFPPQTFADPVLPPLPPHSGLRKKRSWDRHFANDSSDPPLFSSDSLHPTVEDYDSHRTKRQYAGSWWHQGEPSCEYSISGGSEHGALAKPASKKPRQGASLVGTNPGGGTAKRTFQRNIDSAVWMGSDDTEPDVDDRLATSTGNAAATNVAPSAAQTAAYLQILSCVENGVEVVDISDRALGEMHGWMLRPLGHLTRLPNGQGRQCRDAYATLVPDLRLYLCNNDLSTLPAELYTLPNLYSLSIRNNRLTELLPAVSQLGRLEEFNLAANCFRWLPFEAWKFRGTHYRFHPNPFLHPAPRAPSSTGPTPCRHPSPGDRILAYTRTAFLDIDGIPCRGSPPAPSISPGDYVPPTNDAPFAHAANPWNASTGQVPSLLELCLRAYMCNAALDVPPPQLPNDCAPSLQSLLQQAHTTKLSGGKKCTICERSFAVARTEWIEWWHNFDHIPTPFIRRGCSWDCRPQAPEGVQERWRDCGWKDGGGLTSWDYT